MPKEEAKDDGKRGVVTEIPIPTKISDNGIDEHVGICKKINELKRLLGREFDMKAIGVAKKILGMEIKRDRKAGKLWLSQKRYIHKVLEKFSMLDAKAVSTPLASHFVLSAKQCISTDAEMEEMVKVPYANTVGCLMYAMICTRPDISQTVSVIAKYMTNLGKEHWNAIK
ncbi:hypothetical protein EZV62_001245 [Acer yangbiense]|uniref:Reverse transcriptase Ty1/copia-type domain-containing protein n=1 Tax=Acer yangbiense TaxID=1000413 RepID=A0A5C7IVV7_9ROSI|nr:hypothetical protein EZV62_001245 [Acer yangbiense]